MRKFVQLTSLSLAVLVLLCIALPGNSQEEETDEPIFNASSKIGVMPFLKGTYDINIDEPLDKLLTCSIKAFCYISEDILENAEKNLANLTHMALTNRLDGQMIPKDLAMEVVSKMMPFAPDATPKSVSMEAGKLMGADFVLVGSVWRYKNRISAAGGPDKPASVAFVVYLIETKSGRPIWKNRFVKSQTGLTDDITNAPMFFKGGMKWLTADEIAKYGVNVVFKKFPFPRA